jgi:alkylation response protein AidB-like acyl-CoA dehydrogenase
MTIRSWRAIAAFDASLGAGAAALDGKRIDIPRLKQAAILVALRGGRARPVPREVWRKAGAMGMLCCNAPEDYGGAGADCSTMSSSSRNLPVRT